MAYNQCTYSGGSATAAGILVWGGSSVNGTNNISYGNISSNNANYTGSCNLTYTCTTPNLAGIGNISSDPLFMNPAAGNFNLQGNSPCIDTGNPNSPLDPDNTTADMGAFYFDQNFTADITVELTPENPPIIVPANGGSFNFNIAIGNNEATTVNFSVWTTATLPGGSEFGPIVNVAISLPGGVVVDRDRVQLVPANAPAGAYVYNAYVGVYPNNIMDEDHFDLTKSAAFDGGIDYTSWDNWGIAFDEISETADEATVQDYMLLNTYPNPFNETSTVNFSLPGNADISLAVYDITGREVRVLQSGYMSAGSHSFQLDAHGMTSGVYFVKLDADRQTITQKIILLK